MSKFVQSKTNGVSLNPADFVLCETNVVKHTMNVPQTLGVEIGDRKVVFAGTFTPANDDTAEGVVYHDVDVTLGDMSGSVITGGTLDADYFILEPEAKTALESKGIRFRGGEHIMQYSGMEIEYTKEPEEDDTDELTITMQSVKVVIYEKLSQAVITGKVSANITSLAGRHTAFDDGLSLKVSEYYGDVEFANTSPVDIGQNFGMGLYEHGFVFGNLTEEPMEQVDVLAEFKFIVPVKVKSKK